MPTNPTTPLYGILDGAPYRFNDGEAWTYVEDKWHMVNAAEINVHGHILTAEGFSEAFGELPDLPSMAFHSGDRRSSTG